MRKQPVNTIAPTAINAWRITAMINIGILWVAVIVGLILAFIYKWSFLYGIIAVIISGLCTYIFVFLLPKLRWRRWRYQIFEKEIYIQYGILVVSKTLVPMIRVQHVDTKQGPILKRFQLANVTISTAATTHEIPALEEKDASALRDRLAELAKVDEDDV